MYFWPFYSVKHNDPSTELIVAPLRILEERKIVVWKFTKQCSVWELMNAATSRVSKAIMFFLTIHFFVFASQSTMYFWVFFHTQLAQLGKHRFLYEYSETKTSISFVFSSITMCIKQNITEISHSFTEGDETTTTLIISPLLIP